jgi:5-methylthioribose kinase
MDKYFELDVKTVIAYVDEKLNFFDKDAKVTSVEIGDGNLNLVFRLADENTEKSIIVKQALPYLRAAGESWPLDIRRGKIESEILKIEYELTDGLVPDVLFYDDDDMFCMMMEDLSDYVIMRTGLLNVEQYPNFADQITDFLVKTLLLTSDVVVEHKKKKGMVKAFINPELCEITEQLVYMEPFGTYERNNIEPLLVDFAKEYLENDNELRCEVAKLKFDFMNHAQALLHGDLHTGSIFVNKEQTKVIDPEFAFFGPMAYDIGALMANLLMNYLSTVYMVKDEGKKKVHLEWLKQTTENTLDMFKEKFLELWPSVVTDDMGKVPGFAEWYLNDVIVNTAGVAGCEMSRRSVGFAQVIDLNNIADEKQRAEAKKKNVMMAKELIMNRSNIVTGKDYVDILVKYI